MSSAAVMPILQMIDIINQPIMLFFLLLFIVVYILHCSKQQSFECCVKLQLYYQMSRLGTSIQRASRGSSRGISYYNQMKSSLPSYGVSSKKDTKYYETKLLKNNTPAYSSALKGSLRQKNPNSYEYTYQRQKQKAIPASQLDGRRQAKDKNQNFRIRTNTKQSTMASSIKNSKDDQDKQRQLSDSLKRQQAMKLQKQKLQFQKLQKQKLQKQKLQFQKYTMISKQVQIPRKTEIVEKKIEIPIKLYTNTPKTIGLVGLNNIGNTCFMNSTLQCVLNLPGFNDYFLNDSHHSQMKSSARVAESYARLVKLVRSSTSRSETPSQLKSAIGSKRSRFLGYAQQDSQQFLAALLQLLSIDLNRSKNPKYKQLTADTTKHSLKQISDQWWHYHKQREDSVVCDYFTGQILSRVVCSRCKNQSIAFDNIWDMALNFTTNGGGDLLKMVQNFLKEETITNDYYCTKCKTFRECNRKIDFYRLPKILVLQLKRFEYGRWRKTKLNNRVKLQQQLDLSELITQSQHESVKNPVYNLVGIVNHSGDIDFGHYTAECRNPINNKWYNFNDSSVSQTRMREQFQSSSPYLLFYAKKQ